VSVCALSDDGKQLAGATLDRTVKIWDAATGKESRDLGGNEVVFRLAFSADGKRLALCGPTQVTVRDLMSRESKWEFPHTASCVAHNGDGTGLFAAGHDKIIRVWDLQTGRETMALQRHADMIHRLAISPDGTRLFSASSDKTIRIWDVNAGKEVLRLTGHR